MAKIWPPKVKGVIEKKNVIPNHPIHWFATKVCPINTHAKSNTFNIH